MSKESQLHKINTEPLNKNWFKDFMGVLKRAEDAEKERIKNIPLCDICGSNINGFGMMEFCNCGKIQYGMDTNNLLNGGQLTIKAEKGMKQLRSWKQNK
jgi:hypothetical protein